ncbi:hypothetical protein NBRC116583_06930 [Arenicella sp. 4NH20-0111]
MKSIDLNINIKITNIIGIEINITYIKANPLAPSALLVINDAIQPRIPLRIGETTSDTRIDKNQEVLLFSDSI